MSNVANRTRAQTEKRLMERFYEWKGQDGASWSKRRKTTRTASQDEDNDVVEIHATTNPDANSTLKHTSKSESHEGVNEDEDNEIVEVHATTNPDANSTLKHTSKLESHEGVNEDEDNEVVEIHAITNPDANSTLKHPSKSESHEGVNEDEDNEVVEIHATTNPDANSTLKHPSKSESHEDEDNEVVEIHATTNPDVNSTLKHPSKSEFHEGIHDDNDPLEDTEVEEIDSFEDEGDSSSSGDEDSRDEDFEMEKSSFSVSTDESSSFAVEGDDDQSEDEDVNEIDRNRDNAVHFDSEMVFESKLEDSDEVIVIDADCFENNDVKEIDVNRTNVVCSNSESKLVESEKVIMIDDLDLSPSTSGTNDIDSDDKDFNVENSNSFVSIESSSSYLEEVDEGDSNEEKDDDVLNGFPKVNWETKNKCNGDGVDTEKVKVSRKGESNKSKKEIRVGAPLSENSRCSGINRQVTIDPSSGLRDEDDDNATNREGNDDEKVSEKSEAMREPSNKDSISASEDGDIFRIFVNSIMDKIDAPVIDKTCEQAKFSSSVEHTLPLKFKFEDEGPEPAEKSELDQITDDLFAEMQFVINSEEMGIYSHVADNARTSFPAAEPNRTTLCCDGKHHFVLDEEIGIKCLYCPFVELEIKYVTPSFAEYNPKAPQRKYSSDNEDFSMLEGFKFQGSEDGCPQDPCTKGTVWDIIPGIRESMYLHQQEGFEFLWKNLAGTIVLDELKSTGTSGVGGGCIISHAPGTGKTRLTMVFIETFLKLFPNCHPVIIAPASMLLTWEEEFRKWKIEFPFHNVNNLEFSGKESEKALASFAKRKCQGTNEIRWVKIYSWISARSILGISYNLYEKLVGEKFVKAGGKKKRQEKVVPDKGQWKFLLELPGLVVLDEGHTPRNHRSRIWNTLLKLQTERRIILSGTPFQNNFGELFNTLRLVRPAIADILARKKTFADMIPSRARSYCRRRSREKAAPLSRSNSKDVDDAIDQLKTIISPFVHIHKGSILRDSLPGLRDVVILLDPPQLQKNLIGGLQGFQNTFEFEHKVALISVHPSLFLHCKEKSVFDQGMLEQLRLVPDQGVKTNFIMELIRLSLPLNEKVLIFSQYIIPLELIKDQVKAIFDWNEGREILHMGGKLDQKYRQNLIDIFNDPKSEAKILLASTKCCSEGINLVGASRVVLLDVVWNPSVERQAISRAYRLGQKKIVYTYHLMTSGTTEGDKYCRQAEKDRLSELVFSATDSETKKQNDPASVLNDKILEEMIGHEKLKHIFQKIIYQPKDKNLVESFSLASLS